MISRLFSKFNSYNNIIIFLIIFFSLFFTLNIGLDSNIVRAEITNSDMLCPLTTNQDLKLGDIHEDIRVLQKYLNKEGYVLADSGPGSVGRETNYFGYLTQTALTRFQQSKNISAVNLGVYDLATRNYLNCTADTNSEYENKLIKYNNSAKVYKVENDKKRWIVDETTFNYYKFNWNNIILTNKYFETGKNIVIPTNNTEKTNNQDNSVNTGVYTLSGKITGLKGDIILKNNINGDKLNITTSDSSNFTFNKKLSNNEDYDISFTNLAKDNQKCYLTNNIGTITNNNIDNIEIMCGDIVTLNYNPFTFIPNSLPQYTLTYRAGSNGSLTGSTSQTLSQGESGSAVTAVPDSNYHFTSWSDSLTSNPRTDTNVFGSIDVTANFAIDTYTITFAANSNGSITGDTPQTINHGGSTTAVSATPDTNYHFTSWNDGSTDNPRTITNVTSSTTYTASFAIDTYLVTFKDWNGTTLSTSTVDHGENATAPTTDPTRTGYTFTGWDTAYTNITTTTTITAEYSINSYTVTYNDNTSTGGSVPVDGSSPYNYNSSVTVLGNTGTLVKTGYTFAGWNTEVGGGGTDYAPAATFSITTDTILYAQWTINTYTVTFDENTGTTPADPTSVTTTYNNILSAMPSEPTKTGHTFSSWNTLANGSGSSFTSSTAVTSSITVYAVWTINTYTVTFDGNTSDGGSTATQTLNYNTPTNLTANGYTKIGHTFAGWNTLADGTGTAYADTASYTIGAGNVTLYAQWTINTYTVTYNDNTSTGGSVPVDGSSPYNYNSSVTVLGNTGTLVKTGYTFAGWNTEAGGGGTDYAPAATFSITTDTILYAQWMVTLFACGDDVTFTYNGSPVTYGTVSNPATSECWLDRNLGASRVALSSTDSHAYGDLFQWGRPADGHQIRTSGTQSGQVATITPGTNTFIIPSSDWSSIDSDGALRSSYLAKTDGTGICPNGFRVPTETEINAELLSWSSNTSAGAFASPLKLTVSGYRNYVNGSLNNVGVDGYYWSSTVDGASSRYLGFNSGGAGMYSNSRAHGFSVRCLKD